MENDRLRELIGKVRNGSATQAEQREFERFCEWANADQEAFNSLSEEEREVIRLEIYDKVNRRIDEIERRDTRWRFLSTPLMRMAASLSAIAAVAFLYYWINTQSVHYITVSSAYGELTHIVLPDSSEVTLNGNSSIRYNDTWNENNDREVWLVGEGFFDVTHTRNHQQFIVHTEEDMDVQVLGTQFNVKVRRGKAQILLEDGRVRVNGNDTASDTLTLSPGELATYEHGVLVKQRVDPSMYASWRDHRLHFHETPLYEIAHMLEDTYGYKVSFADRNLANRKLSGQIQSKNVDEIFTAIEESLGIDIQVSDSLVVVRPSAP